MRVLTTVPGKTIPCVPAELIECIVDLPDIEPYNTSDWYAVRLIGLNRETVVSGDKLGPIVVDDGADSVG
jgi:hypothetical protein